MKALTTILFLFCAVATTHARLISDWPYSKLVLEADFVAVVEVISVRTLIPAITLPLLLAPMGDIGLCLMVPCEFILIATLVITCFLKGEPVGWRWGNKEQDNHEESNKPSDATR